MRENHRFLRQEVARWQAEGLVDAALAQRLIARYPVDTAPGSASEGPARGASDAAPGGVADGERGWGRMVFSAIGAALVGLGVILFFAYNWADLPKVAKLALIFGALAAAHGGAIAVARRSPDRHALAEGLHVLGTMLFGAAIWLVAQIYHIDEHYPNAFFAWALGALALAWALPSIVQALLALALVALWAGVEAFEFRAPMHGAPLLVALGVLPLAWWRRSPVLMFWGLVILFVVSGFALGWAETGSVLPFLMLVAAAAFVAGIAASLSAFPAAAGPLTSVGVVATIVVGYALSFPNAARELLKVAWRDPVAMTYLGVATVLLVAAIAWCAVLMARHGWREISVFRRQQLGLVALAMLVALVTVLLRKDAQGWLLALPYNVIVLALAGTLIAEGSALLRPGRVAAGCVLFAIVTMSRYADLFTSLLARSAVFIALGAGLFVVGNFYARRRRQAAISKQAGA